MQSPTWCLVLTLAALLAGCAHEPAYRAKMMDLSGRCAEGRAQLVPTALTTESDGGKTKERAYAEFADVAQCIQSPAGHQAVAFYELKGMSSAYEVDVSVQRSTGGTFAATVELLDDDRKPIQVYSFDKFVRRGSEYGLTIFPPHGDHRARFLLVTPDVAFVGKSDTVTSSIATMTYPAVPNGHEVQSVMPLMAGGKLLVTMRDSPTGHL